MKTLWSRAPGAVRFVSHLLWRRRAHVHLLDTLQGDASRAGLQTLAALPVAHQGHPQPRCCNSCALHRQQLAAILATRSASYQKSGLLEMARARQPWRRRLQAAAARGYSTDTYLKGIDAEYREDVAKVLELAERAAETWTLAYSDFLTPPVVAVAMQVLERLAFVGAMPWGGYPQAERCRLLVGQEDAVDAARADPAGPPGVAALELRGNFLFEAATHRDFLGACLGTGIVRGKVGDIILQGEQGAQLLTVPELADFLCTSLTAVRKVPVVTRPIPLSELRVRPAKVETIASSEASLRLDAVASAGFRLSRAKMTDLIKSGDVRVNWKPGKASMVVKAGDVISCAGKGRVEVTETNVTKKGRFGVQMTRYV